ncbi:MAG: endonuclease/exonuclease/phosphatase family protein [Henriciella sp.]|nr:endonuclease/exonuclease/phosphatase family protein [Henriciella sp.]
MAMYKDLRRYGEAKSAHVAQRILGLREKLHDEITGPRRSNSLIIGSWNIRNFDNGFGGERTDEAYHYIAEIIDRFDICAIQEVMGDMEPLKRLVRTLGPQWDYFVTDVTDGSKGNNERGAFVFNKNKVFFRNLVGEIVLKADDLIDDRQFARTPFFAAFQAHWFRFILCSTHVIYGGSDKAAEAARAKEIKALAVNLKKRSEKDGEVYVLLGDLNVVDKDNVTMDALKAGNLMIPDFGGTNLGENKYYDQLTFTGQGEKVRLIRHGKFDWRDKVFTPGEADHYEQYNVKDDGTPRYSDWDKKYHYWMTHQMSDHLPIWVELEIDYSDDYLKRFIPTA